MEKLSRNEMRCIVGGFINPPTDCTAKCADGTKITCSGSSCTANDAVKGVDGSCTGDSNKFCKSTTS